MEQERWSPLPPGFIKINVDGATMNSWGKGGIGGLSRYLASISKAVGQGPPVLAELLAIKQGISMFFDLEVNKKNRLIVESDCKTALDWVKDPLLCPGPFLDLVGDIVSVIRERVIVFCCVKRSVNAKADELAKQGIG
ncbi:uncharacterized protein LOC120194242 [Hibiscus syriacus]|uniref:uncharacterized protein LOC120194242 n=1 Tax=Hibiscus syriacus TaxID=106335 RepID=UPI00192396F6|nr:uncharacterized protein LOC120194242 [Hibiscus syriacus]